MQNYKKMKIIQSKIKYYNNTFPSRMQDNFRRIFDECNKKDKRKKYVFCYYLTFEWNYVLFFLQSKKKNY